MAISVTVPASGSGSSTTNANTYTTASLSFTAGRVVIAAVFTSRVGTGQTFAFNTDTGGILGAWNSDFTNWSLIFGTAGTPTERVSFGWALCSSSGSSTLTFNGFAANQLHCGWIVMEVAGANTLAPIRQVKLGTAQDSGTSYSITFDSATNGSNGTLGIASLKVSSASSITNGGSFTELAEVGVGAEVGEIETEWASTGINTVNWTNTNNPIGGIAIELAESITAAKKLAALGVG